MRKWGIVVLIFAFVGLSFSAIPTEDRAPVTKKIIPSKITQIQPVKKPQKIEPRPANYTPYKFRQNNPVGILSGGPDAFGYVYLSTQDGDPISFNWIEINTTGTDLGLTDDSWTTVTLSFNFPFYDATYNWVSVGSNGVVYFEDYYIGLSNTALPSNSYGGGDLIAVFWDDLNPSAAGAVYFQDFGTYAVIEWDGVPRYGQTEPNTFEVILYDNGDILIQYKEMLGTYTDATVGIQDTTAYPTGNGWFLEYVYAGNPPGHIPTGNVAVQFVYPVPSACDVGVISIDEPTGVVGEGTVVTPTSTVKNFGTDPQTFDVYFEIYDATPSLVYQDFTTVTVSAGATQSVSFTPWTASPSGIYSTVSYTVLACDSNFANDTTTGGFTVQAIGNDYLIIDLDPTPGSGATINSILQSLGYAGMYTYNDPTQLNAANMSSYSTVWLFLGIYPNNYVLSTAEVAEISTYLNGGGRMFVEGGDCWGFDASRTDLDPLFGIDPSLTLDGSADLYTFNGVTNTLIPEVDGHSWSYNGENNWIDRLVPYTTPPYGGLAQGYLENPDIPYFCGVAYSNATWNAVGHSFETGLITQTSRSPDSLVSWIMDFLLGPTYQIHDVGMLSILSPVGPYVEPGTTVSVQARIKNFGSFDESNFYVYAEIPEVGYSDNQLVSFLAAGDSMDITFADWTVPSTSGDFTLIIYTALSGDENPLNDTLTRSLRNYIAPGEVLYALDVQTPTGDNQCLGVEFDGTYFYVTGGNTGLDPNKVYVLDVNGNLICAMDQASWSTGWGWRDLANDDVSNGIPTDTLYGSVSSTVDPFGIYPGCSLLTYTPFNGPENPNRALAYRPSDAHFFTANFSGPIYEFDKSGTVYNTWSNTYAAYGAAYDDSLDKIWFSTQDLNSYGQYNMLYCFDPASGTFIDSLDFDLPPGWTSAFAGGLCYWPDWNGKNVLIELVQGDPTDFIAVVFLREAAPACVCGDMNGDGFVNMADLSYLAAYLFFGGPPPVDLNCADVNGDGFVNMADLSYLAAYLFFGGPPPNCP
jgi:hypothetical protein